MQVSRDESQVLGAGSGAKIRDLTMLFLFFLMVGLPSGEHTKSYWKWWFIVDFPIKNGDFPWQNVSSPEGKQ